MKILVINGPNINMLGIREPEIYGSETYDDLVAMIKDKAAELGVTAEFYQSNHEGDLVDAIQAAYKRFDGIIINPAGYTHTSVAIPDAIKAVGIPAVEVHISDPDTREDFRRVSYVRPVCTATVKGEGLKGYLKALEILVK
ncbi:MAG: type II 3-dehydroquinate dehydratase [Clostridia bacterium]|nr:type II 3-dehydroquinate dehydratase [Clostridia bacterium]